MKHNPDLIVFLFLFLIHVFVFYVGGGLRSSVRDPPGASVWCASLHSFNVGVHLYSNHLVFQTRCSAEDAGADVLEQFLKKSQATDTD